ncbi:MAG: hypothetical protein V4675_08855 [Verrucomicrobiota bacterium]
MLGAAMGPTLPLNPGSDLERRPARVWIEHQSPARIVVRVHPEYDIAHDDVKTGAPGKDGQDSVIRLNRTLDLNVFDEYFVGMASIPNRP